MKKLGDIYLLLGSNLGDRQSHLSQACKLIETYCGDIVKKSSIYETAPWGKSDQPFYLNQVIAIHTNQSPSILLDQLLQIEKQLGRVRDQKWGARIIDIDILYYENQTIDSEKLMIPHPEIQNRRFTLLPMVEVNATFMHPTLKKNQQELLDQCSDPLEVNKH